MTDPTSAKSPFVTMLIALVTAAAPVGFFLSIPWLRDQPDPVVYGWTAIAAVTVMAGCELLARRAARSL